MRALTCRLSSTQTGYKLSTCNRYKGVDRFPANTRYVVAALPYIPLVLASSTYQLPLPLDVLREPGIGHLMVLALSPEFTRPSQFETRALQSLP